MEREFLLMNYTNLVLVHDRYDDGVMDCNENMPMQRHIIRAYLQL
jgi:hypothetical protein